MSIQLPVVVGVDPHADTLAASGTDAVGVEVFHLEVPNTTEGIGQLIDKVNSSDVRWAIEGTGTYGRQLCDRLLAQGSEVVEVPTRLTARYRSKAGRRKTGRGDATAIARAGLMDPCSGVSHHPVPETLRVLVTQRKALVETRVEAVNRLRARLRELDPDSPLVSGRLRSIKAITALTKFTQQPHSSQLEEALEQAIGMDATNWLTMTNQTKQLERALKKVLPPVGDALTEIVGIGLIGAATIIGHTGNIDRFPTESHYASFCGTAPVDVSSGRQQRHRLNR
jgi:transposase